jgi:hypothetical protein
MFELIGEGPGPCPKPNLTANQRLLCHANVLLLSWHPGLKTNNYINMNTGLKVKEGFLPPTVLMTNFFEEVLHIPIHTYHFGAEIM